MRWPIRCPLAGGVMTTLRDLHPGTSITLIEENTPRGLGMASVRQCLGICEVRFAPAHPSAGIYGAGSFDAFTGHRRERDDV